MESSSDKNWAAKYLLDPLNDPEPSQETGPGSHFYAITPSSPSSSSHNRQVSSGKGPSTSISGLPTPPESASPTRSTFHPTNPYFPSYRQSAFSGYSPDPRHSRRSLDDHVGAGKQHRRSNSQLDERFPGDMSHRPLDQIRKETKTAHRSPHLRKKHIPGTDVIDSLDQTALGGAYHHGGPYDATLLARNLNPKSSPVAATSKTNEEAIKATPKDYMKDSLRKHLPLQGTAVIPPGEPSLDGRVMQYEEGADLQREADAPGGAYKRWPDMQYHPEDYKGKGEPSFSVDRALKEHKHNTHRRIMSDGNSAYKMQRPRARASITRQRSASGNNADLGRPSGSATSSTATGRTSTSGNDLRYSDFEADMNRRNSTGHTFGEGLKKRFGSLTRNIKA